jgi:GT2 family glycosyltransferase
MAQATGSDEYNVAFLNSDLGLWPGSVGTMAEALRHNDDFGAVCPDYNRRVSDGALVIGARLRPVVGSYREGGLCGWCFMVRGELRETHGLRIDEEYEWYCGDDDLFAQIETAGYRLGVIEGLPLDHVGSATARHYPELEPAKGRDFQRFFKKWPGHG